MQVLLGILNDDFDDDNDDDDFNLMRENRFSSAGVFNLGYAYPYGYVKGLSRVILMTNFNQSILFVFVI